MTWPIHSLNDKMEQILRDHLVEGMPIADVATVHSVSKSYVYQVVHSVPGLRWMLANISPAQSSLNLKVVAALNSRIDQNVNAISTADLVRLLVATTPKEVASQVYEGLQEQAEKMADENGLEGPMRDRFIDTVLGGLKVS